MPSNTTLSVFIHLFSKFCVNSRLRCARRGAVEFGGCGEGGGEDGVEGRWDGVVVGE